MDSGNFTVKSQLTVPTDDRSNPPIGGRLILFTNQWETTATDTWVLNTVRLGLTLKYLSTPLSFFICCPVSKDKTKRGLMETAVQHLLDIQAIQVVPKGQQEQGFYSILFVVSKTSGWGERAILDMKRLNRHLIYRRFKMQSLQSILESIQEGNFLTFIDLTEAYLHIAILLSQWRFLRFHYVGRHYQYKALPFSLSSAPRTFAKLLAALAAHLRAIPVRVQCYLDDILIQCSSPLRATEDLQSQSGSFRITGSPSTSKRATWLRPTNCYTWGRS